MDDSDKMYLRDDPTSSKLVLLTVSKIGQTLFEDPDPAGDPTGIWVFVTPTHLGILDSGLHVTSDNSHGDSCSSFTHSPILKGVKE